MRVYTNKLTPDSVVTYLLHDCERSLWLFCLVWHVRTCDDQSTVHLDWQLGGYSSARVRNVWGINRGLLRISIWFSCQFAGFHVANRTVIDVSYYCADVWSVLAHFGSEYSRERPSTGRSGQVDSVFMSHFSWRDRWPISCSGSAVSVAAPARLRLFARCALVRNSLQTATTRYHTPDTMLELGARK